MVQNGARALTPSDIQNVIDVIHQDYLPYVGYESLEKPAISQAVSGARWTV
jgi:hypothetical protein